MGRCTNDPLQTDLVRCVDFVLGGFYLFGTQPFFHSVELWDPDHEHASELEASRDALDGLLPAYRSACWVWVGCSTYDGRPRGFWRPWPT